MAFRYDDYSNVSPSAIEGRMFRAFELHGFRCTVAVIPFTYSSASGSPITYPAGQPLGSLEPLNAEKAGLLEPYISNGTVEVAQHGYAHRALPRWRGVTEFSGVDAATQRAEIAEGAKLLGRVTGSPARVFVPPFDSYDSTTVQTLENLGFQVLSASRAGTSNNGGRIRFVPWTTRLEELKQAVAAARRSPDPAPAVIVIFHPFDFTEVNSKIGKISFSGFTSLLDWLKAQPGVTEESVGELAGQDFTAAAFRANHRLFYLETELGPPLLARWDLTGTGRVYTSVSTADAELYKAVLPDALFYAAVLTALIAASFGGAKLARPPQKLLRLGRTLLWLLALFLLIYVFRNGRPLFMGATALAGVAGIAGGLELARLRQGRA